MDKGIETLPGITSNREQRMWMNLKSFYVACFYKQIISGPYSVWE